MSASQSDTDYRREEVRGLFVLGLLAVLIVVRFQNEELMVRIGQSSMNITPLIDMTIMLWSLYAFFMVLGMSDDVVGKSFARTFRNVSTVFLQIDFLWTGFLATIYFILGYSTRALWIVAFVGVIALSGFLLSVRKMKVKEIKEKTKMTRLELTERASLLLLLVFAAALLLFPYEQYLVIFFVLGLASFAVFAFVKERRPKEKTKSSDNRSETVKESNSKSRASIKVFSKIVYDFRRILSACILVLVFSIALYVSFSIYPPTNSILAVSRATPWGIVTSIFVHSSLIHLASNMAGLFAYTLLFAVCNSSLASETRMKIQSFFLVCAFGSAIASNILWVFLTSQPSLGASGVSYAIQGILLGFSLINGLSILNWKRFRTQGRSTKLMVLFNLLVLIMLLSQIFLSPELFLSVAVGVNVLAHGFSFYSSLVITFVWNYYIKKVSILI